MNLFSHLSLSILLACVGKSVGFSIIASLTSSQCHVSATTLFAQSLSQQSSRREFYQSLSNSIIASSVLSTFPNSANAAALKLEPYTGVLQMIVVIHYLFATKISHLCPNFARIICLRHRLRLPCLYPC
jgi:hypothetical protein